MTLHVRRAFAAALAMGLVALGAIGCGDSGGTNQDGAAPAKPAASAAPSFADGAVRVTLGEWALQPSVRQVKAGKVRFIAANTGRTEHEMVVIRTDRDADDLGAGARIPEDGSIGEIAEFGAGKVQAKTLTLTPGHYALVCNINGHYKQGMWTDLEVLSS